MRPRIGRELEHTMRFFLLAILCLLPFGASADSSTPITWGSRTGGYSCGRFGTHNICQVSLSNGFNYAMRRQQHSPRFTATLNFLLTMSEGYDTGTYGVDSVGLFLVDGNGGFIEDPVAPYNFVKATVGSDSRSSDWKFGDDGVKNDMLLAYVNEFLSEDSNGNSTNTTASL